MIAFYRIKRVKNGAIIEGIIFAIAIGIQVILPFPYGMIIALVITIIVPVHYARKWTIEYNSRI